MQREPPSGSRFCVLTAAHGSLKGSIPFTKAQFTPFPLLTDDAETPNGNIEHKEWVYRNSDPVPQHARAAQDAHSSRQRPCDENEIDRYPGDCREAQGTQKGSDHEREQGVTDDAHGLEERARDESAPLDPTIKRTERNTYIFPPSSLICKVTTASPIQTIEKTPEKTRSD